MATAGTTFLTEETIVDTLHRRMKEASVCRVAVSYCGEAAHRFFPEAEADRPEVLRILVDASPAAVARGLTNPKGLTHLLGLTQEVRWLAGLHSKAFIFDQERAIVGSVNLSATSVESQYQAVVETTSKSAVVAARKWFDQRWDQASKLDSQVVKRLQKLWPGGERAVSASRNYRKNLPTWRHAPPQPPPSRSDFTVGIPPSQLRRLLTEFKNNQCPYLDHEGQSCSDVSKAVEQHYSELGRELRRLMRRRAAWTREDLDRIFDIAYTNGRAAKLRKPLFLRQRPARVAATLTYLVEGPGDPYVRFEKVLAKAGRFRLPGLGETGVTFLMHLWSPAVFAVVNDPVDKGLRILRVTFGRRTSLRRAQGYKDRTAAIEHIASVTGLRSFARVDHFFDALGKGHIGP